MKWERVSLDEYNRIYRTRKSSPVCKDHTKTEVLQQAMAAIRNLQNNCQPEFFNSSIKLSIRIKGKTRADKDNIFKGIADGLQGYAFKNDKQIRSGYFE